MLAVVLQVLKIIGIVLAVLLGIILVLVLSVLFVPVRYRITCSAKPDGQVHGQLLEAILADESHVKVSASWLLHIVHFHYHIQRKDGSGSQQTILRLFGINSTSLLSREEKDTKKSKDNSKKKKKADREESVKEEELSVDLEEEFSADFEKESSTYLVKEQSVFETSDSFETDDMDLDDVSDESHDEDADASDGFSLAEKWKHFIESLKKLFEKIKGIKYTISNKLNDLNESKQRMQRVIKVFQSKRAKVVFAKVKKELLRIWKHLRPKCKGNLVIGTGDPESMGEILAVFGMLIGIMPSELFIVPDFEQARFEGLFTIKGKVCVYWFIKAVWMYLFDKDIKRLKAMYKKATTKREQKPIG